MLAAENFFFTIESHFHFFHLGTFPKGIYFYKIVGGNSMLARGGCFPIVKED